VFRRQFPDDVAKWQPVYLDAEKIGEVRIVGHMLVTVDFVPRRDEPLTPAEERRLTVRQQTRPTR
jgi:hypothetical protein